jgi:predicted RNA-binding Zn-ribbon protein involved in translation (DUF1610 family)
VVSDMDEYYYLHYTSHLEIKVRIKSRNNEEIVECPSCKMHLRVTSTAYICPECGWDLKHNMQTMDDLLELEGSEISPSRDRDEPQLDDFRKNIIKCSCGISFDGPRFNYKCPKCSRQH